MLDSLKILVLNHTYEPLQFCNAKRGLVMVLTGRAEQLESDGFVVRSPAAEFRLPTVIRVLKAVKRGAKKGLAFSKKNILRRDNYTCQYCGQSSLHLTVDHILPKSRGGKTTWTNVVVACKPCNLRKGSQTLVEAEMALLRKPYKPDFQLYPFTIPSSPKSFLESWQKYLPAKSFAGLANNN
ncbi:MAG: HNH endonuclease [Nitrospinae bacterium]|nr:HNH endonuclease [Nitrospinota bacterium]